MKATSNIYDHLNLVQNEVLTVGMKARLKIGGPEMMIVGFCATSPPKSADIRSDRATYHDNKNNLLNIWIYPKLEINHEKLSYKQRANREGSSIPDHFAFYKMNDSEPIQDGTHRYYVVLNYYSEKNEDFVYKIVHTNEIELL